MSCPDREQLSRHLDRPEPDLERHLGGCRTCAAELTRLQEVDALLRAGASCPTPGAVLAALARVGGPTPGACDPCATEVASLREVLALHDKNELARPSADLRARLKRLAPAGAATAAELAPTRASARLGSSRVRRPSREGAVSGQGRTATSRRRVIPFPGARVGRRQEPWLWAVVASAAALLFAFGVALTSGSRGGGGTVARAPLPPSGARSAPRQPLVSDQAARPSSQQPPSARRTEDAPPASEPDPGTPGDTRTPGELPGEVAVEPAPERAPPPADRPAGSEGPTLASTAPEPAPPARGRETAAPAAAPPRVPAADDGGRLAVVLERVVGAPQLASAGQGFAPLTRGGQVELRPGDRLRTGARGAFLSLEDGAYELALDAETELEVRAAASGPVLLLERGKVLCDVASLVPGRRFTVETAQGALDVLGTTFGVEARAEATRLIVLEGTVAASSPAGSAEVSAGFGSAFTRERAPAAEPADARLLAWSRDLLPRREPLLEVDFDDRVLGGFEGEVTPEGALGGRGLSLLLGHITDNRYFGQRARAAEGRIGAFRAGRELWVQASVWSEEATDVTLIVTNATQKKDFKLGFSLPARRWKTVHVPLMDLTTYFDPGKNPMREGDLLTGIEVFAAKPGATHRVLLDGVAVYRKHYR